MTLKVPISPRSSTRLRAKAQRLGLTPERYVKHLVEEYLSLDREARETTFDELMAPTREEFRRSGVTEAQLDKLVDRARKRHHKRLQQRRGRAGNR